MDKIEKIRQEIERRLKDYWKICFYDVKIYNEDSNVRELKEFLSFLDTLTEEPDKALEESADEFSKTYKTTGEKTWEDDIKTAYIVGAKWHKEQMMKEAVEGIARPDDCEIWVNLVGYGYKFNDGDKVRIVVLPKED